MSCYPKPLALLKDPHFIDMIMEHEGLRLNVYKDSLGHATIGYGHLLTRADKKHEVFNEGISLERAKEILMGDLYTAALGARDIMYGREIPYHPVVYQVLTDMTFNLGKSRLLRFKKTLALLQIQDYEAASVEMLDSRWARQVGRRAKHLSKMIKNI